jgi:hypothetical protein
MSNFFDDQGRTRVFAEATIWYVAPLKTGQARGNPRRTYFIGKRAISGWTRLSFRSQTKPAMNKKDISGQGLVPIEFTCKRSHFHWINQPADGDIG